MLTSFYLNHIWTHTRTSSICMMVVVVVFFGPSKTSLTERICFIYHHNYQPIMSMPRIFMNVHSKCKFLASSLLTSMLLFKWFSFGFSVLFIFIQKPKNQMQRKLRNISEMRGSIYHLKFYSIVCNGIKWKHYEVCAISRN